MPENTTRQNFDEMTQVVSRKIYKQFLEIHALTKEFYQEEVIKQVLLSSTERINNQYHVPLQQLQQQNQKLANMLSQCEKLFD
jgi:S-adenosylmethionine/arginine decarboxylase-like enzyme